MLKDSFAARLFIRTCIFCLKSVAPLSITYCTLRVTGFLRLPARLFPLQTALDVYTASESVFYLLAFPLRTRLLNRDAPPYLPLSSREERQKLFYKTWEATAEPYGYVSLWFKGVPVEKLGREDVRDWIKWRMWNDKAPVLDENEEEELEEYVLHVEDVLDYSFPKGHSEYSAMAVTFEPLRIMRRPLLWYLVIIGGVDFELCIRMMCYGYRHHCFSVLKYFKSLPFRAFPLLLFHSKSPSKRLTYWYLPHDPKENDTTPILFIHGIGVGLHYYMKFLKELREINKRLGTGVISLELLPISSRISPPILHGADMAREIQGILQHHGWSRCIVVSHSYGSVVTAHMLKDPHAAPLIRQLVFVDPVAFSFHSPNVPWNFLRRKPTTASEIQLQYFASTDPDVAYTLTRKFVWPDNSLWREDLEERVKQGEDGRLRRCTVALAGRDIIVDTEDLGSYLTYGHERIGGSGEDGEPFSRLESGDAIAGKWKEQEWTGEEALGVMWFPRANHAEIFDDRSDRARILEAVERYCCEGSEGA